MSNNILDVIPAVNTLDDYKAALEVWQPPTVEHAIRFKGWLSILTGKAGQAANAACTQALLEECNNEDCTEIVHDGFKAQVVTKKKVTWKESKTTRELSAKRDKLKKELAAVEARLRAEYEVNGVDTEVTEFSHFLMQSAK